MNNPVTNLEVQDCIKRTKAFIKQLRQSAKEQNHRADELAKSNSILIKQAKNSR